MTQDGIVRRAQAVLTPNYRQAPVVLVRGVGSRVWDADGREYLDCIAGIATVELAEALLGTTSWAKRAFFCNSGAESNEAMLKLARKLHADQGHPERHEIVACENSFHGR